MRNPNLITFSLKKEEIKAICSQYPAESPAKSVKKLIKEQILFIMIKERRKEKKNKEEEKEPSWEEIERQLTEAGLQ